MKRALFIVCATLLGVAALQLRPTVIADTAPPAQRFSVDEIGRSLLLVGRLGYRWEKRWSCWVTGTSQNATGQRRLDSFLGDGGKRKSTERACRIQP